jgi:hypothetical protein
MDALEPLQRVSAQEPAPNVGTITATSDFHFADRRGRSDQEQAKRREPKRPEPQDDEVVLSDVAHVSLLEEEGLSVTAIAAGLGLSPSVVLKDIAIASEIRHAAETATPLGKAATQSIK